MPLLLTSFCTSAASFSSTAASAAPRRRAPWPLPLPLLLLDSPNDRDPATSWPNLGLRLRWQLEALLSVKLIVRWRACTGMMSSSLIRCEWLSFTARCKGV